MAIHNIKGVKVHTNHDYPPIPVRNMDWSAVTDDYDCDCDQHRLQQPARPDRLRPERD
jgi:hypothetical protein